MAHSRTRLLRLNSTDAERALWHALRDRRLAGAKFRRQQRIGPYIVDFVCHEHRLVLEVDGGQHALKDESRRDELIIADGYRILRIWNNEVLQNLEGTLMVIERALRATPHPPIALRAMRDEGSIPRHASLSHKGRGVSHDDSR